MSNNISLSQPVRFTKMSGTGNDFILIDHRQKFLAEDEIAEFASKVCRRQFSVGADGLILIEPSTEVDFQWQFYNADGSVAEMCGNGARCAARFAFEKGIAPAKMRFNTIAGIIEAEMVGNGVKIQLTAPTDLQMGQKLMLDNTEQEVHYINTGVPHVVCFSEHVFKTPVFEWGKAIRNHALYQPAGTNANFVEVKNGDLLVRTYERGVENETMACGTGAVASAIIAALQGWVESPVAVTTSGGEKLVIHFTSDNERLQVSDVFLEGPASFIYEGDLHADALA